MRFKLVTLGPVSTTKYHAYIVTHDLTDPTQPDMYFRGGPGGVNWKDWHNWIYVSSIYGNIAATSGEYNPDAKDWEPNPDPKKEFPDRYTDQPCEQVDNRFNHIEGEINVGQFPYQPVLQNSNSTVYTLLYYSGFNPQSTTPVPAPAWHHLLYLPEEENRLMIG